MLWCACSGPALPVSLALHFYCRLLYETACGVSHMHGKGKVHRDIKAGNIIVVGEGDETTLTAKVADFGMTCGEKTKEKKMKERHVYIVMHRFKKRKAPCRKNREEKTRYRIVSRKKRDGQQPEMDNHPTG